MAMIRAVFVVWAAKIAIFLAMITCSIAHTKDNLSSCVARAEAGEPVLITRHGRPVAAMISAEEWERLQAARDGKRKGLIGLIGGLYLAAAVVPHVTQTAWRPLDVVLIIIARPKNDITQPIC